MLLGPGPALSASAVANPINNAPPIQEPISNDIPTEHEFEIYRLRRRVAELESAISDRDDRIRHSLASLEDELLFWRTFMLDKVGETLGQLHRRIGRLESSLAFIKDIQPHIYPPLQIPAQWKK
jgi:hypothetical protein